MLKIVVYESVYDWQSKILQCCPDVQVMICRHDAMRPNDLEKAEILIGWQFPPDLLRQLPQLCWIQLISVGADEVVRSPWIRPEVVLTNTRAIYADSLAEYVLWALLTLSRKFHQVLRNQSKRRWAQEAGSGLQGKTLGVIGLGSIGRAVAVRAKSFGLKVIGIKRQVDPSGELDLEGVDELYPPPALKEVLSRSDMIVLCLPLTEETRGMINHDTIRNIKPGAIFINLARAGLVNESALVQALKERRISGAALDVFAREPLRRWDRLWKLDNLIVTPHLAALTNDYWRRVGDLVCKNIEHYRAGKPLLNVVDRLKGY